MDGTKEVNLNCSICSDFIKKITISVFLKLGDILPLCNKCKKKHYEKYGG